jgi:uncharacterized lipoprotein YddW (UPF0748 family)
MNAGYGTHPFGRLYNGSMWFQHPEWRFKVYPVMKENAGVLSFAFPEVRKARIGVLTEMAEFGCTGVNLDFCRYPYVLGYEQPMLDLFTATFHQDGKALPLDGPKWTQVRQKVMNDFMRDVRAAMDEAGQKRGKRVAISVRLPATYYETFGYDPVTWVKEKWVDAIIPSYTAERWCDAAPWTQLVGNSGVKIWPNMEFQAYETSQTELTDDEIKHGAKAGRVIGNEHADYLRRAAEAYAAGADGIHLFNTWVYTSLVTGISDSTYVHHWRRFEDLANLGESW